MKIDVQSHERAFIHLNGRPVQYLRPGRHSVFRPFSRVHVERVDTRALIADLESAQLALVPADELSTVTVASHERAIVWRRGRPVKWLGPGTHLIWITDFTYPHGTKRAAVELQIVDTREPLAAPLSDELRALIPSSDCVEVTALAGSVALRYIDGALDAVLPAGRHAAWNVVHKVQLTAIDLRERILQVNGQEVMTQDRVSLRLNLSAAFEVKDARRLATVARAPDEVLYLAMQLGTREAISSRTLDGVLADREALATELHAAVSARAEALGLSLIRFGIKDVILPGEMKALLNRVIEAQKEAEANVILRREETAAARSMAQTAKVMADNPLLLRLKELEAYKDLAGKVGQVHLVLGEGSLPKLELKT
jgi:regulator of protease activity HflC (stomatin/prohibitin superfamily)